MNIESNRRWALISRPKKGPVSLDCFRLDTAALPALKEGEFRVQVTMLSFDPTQRFWMERDTYMPKIPLGEVMRGAGVGNIIESKNSLFPLGAKVAGLFGWQSYATCNGLEYMSPYLVPDFVSDEAALSIFGMTGLTGYFGMLDIGKVKAGEIVLVSGASGATGSIAAQVAKIQGARVIGIAGNDEKLQWLLDKAKLDAVINYKTQDINNKIKEYAPAGIDIYFDNVGGAILDAALSNLAMHARVVLCGAISTYDGLNEGAIKNYLNLVLKRARMEGFLVFDYRHRSMEAFSSLSQWLQKGKLHYEVDVQEGLENAPKTLQRIFEGKNLGKQLLRI